MVPDLMNQPGFTVLKGDDRVLATAVARTKSPAPDEQSAEQDD